MEGKPNRRGYIGKRRGGVMMTEKGRAVLSRVVFYDLLAVPGRDRDPRFGSHISIPLEPGTQPVWAPNGYGKTFAFNLLSKLSHPSDYSDADVGTGDFWLGNFLKECYTEVREPSHWMTIGELHTASPTKGAMASSWKTDDSQRMVPFTHMLARFKILDDDDRVSDVWDLWVQPIWEGGAGHCRTRLRTLSGLVELVGSDNFHKNGWQILEDTDTSLRIKNWADIHKGRSDPAEGGEDEDKLFSNGWRLFDFLRDDGDLEIASLFGEVLGYQSWDLPQDQLLEFVKLREVGGSSKDPFLPVIPSRSCLHDIWTDDGSGIYRLDKIANWAESHENIDARRPSEEFAFTQTYQCLEVLRRTQIRYVEVPKSVRDNGLDEVQDLVSGMKEMLAESEGLTGPKGTIDSRQIEKDIRVEMYKIMSDVVDQSANEIEVARAEFNQIMEKYDGDEKPEHLIKALDQLIKLDDAHERLVYSQQNKLKEIEKLTQEGEEVIEETHSFLETLEGSINRILGSDEDNPWTRVAMVSPSSEGASITFRQPEARGGHAVREDTLSFGQKSAVTTECWIAWLENEDLDHMNNEEIRRCLILDEPEAGRSEYWIRLLADRIVDADEEIDGIRDKSLVIMSHREELLRRLDEGGHFHVMQPSDIAPALAIDDWGDEPEDEEEVPADLLATPEEVMNLGMRLPGSEDLSFSKPLVRALLARTIFLRGSLIRSYCRSIGVSDRGSKVQVTTRLLDALERIFEGREGDMASLEGLNSGSEAKDERNPKKPIEKK